MHAQQAKTRPSPPLQKNVGADSISARACLRQGKLPRAHIECAPTDFVFNKGRQLHAGHRLCAGAPPATKNVGADSISARARLRQDKPPRAHIECAPTGFVFDKGRKLRAGHRPLRGGTAHHKKRRGGFHIRPCPLAVRQTSAGAYRMRPYGSRFQQRETTPRVAPPLRGDSARHKKHRGGFHIRPCPLAAR